MCWTFSSNSNTLKKFFDVLGAQVSGTKTDSTLSDRK